MQETVGDKRDNYGRRTQDYLLAELRITQSELGKTRKLMKALPPTKYEKKKNAKDNKYCQAHNVINRCGLIYLLPTEAG